MRSKPVYWAMLLVAYPLACAVNRATVWLVRKASS